jgi:flagellar biosynthesis/type III secretory pathway ATPase
MLNMYGNTNITDKSQKVQEQFRSYVMVIITDQKKGQVQNKVPLKESCQVRVHCSLLGLLLDGLGNIIIGRIL